VHECIDGIQGVVIGTHRGGPAAERQHAPIRVDQPCRELGGAEIDADDEIRRPCFHHSLAATSSIPYP
jgi:hypothetical protein